LTATPSSELISVESIVSLTVTMKPFREAAAMQTVMRRYLSRRDGLRRSLWRYRQVAVGFVTSQPVMLQPPVEFTQYRTLSPRSSDPDRKG
jgi:hypothetical protein